MICDLEVIRPSGRLYRVARGTDPWSWPDWAHAGEDGTFGNRYDDREGGYRVVYASSQRQGAFLETLARFRPAPEILAAGIADDPASPTNPPGLVPKSWVAARTLGTAQVAEDFADVGRARSLSYLRERLAARLIHYKLDDLDAASIRLGIPRGLTQEISRLVYECFRESGERAFLGVRYRSRLGDEIENWAICEPAEFLGQSQDPISLEDPDLQAVVELLKLKLG